MARIAVLSVRELRGVGPKLAEKLANHGVVLIEDLLFHLPRRYQDRTRVTPIAAAREGDDIVVEGEVKVSDVVFGKRRSLVVRLQDGSGTLTLRFFHFSAAQRNNLVRGSRLRCFGQLRRGRSGFEMYHPEYRQVEDDGGGVEEALTPIYPTSAGIGQTQWRNLCQQALDHVQRIDIKDLLPNASSNSFDLIQALQYLHAPPPDAPQEMLREGSHPAQLRLALEELVAHNLSLRQLRARHQRDGAPALPYQHDMRAAFLSKLSFTPTAAQEKVCQEIADDLIKPYPMLRLVQGDVGSGKTLVAACAALQAIGSGYQVAIMAPTEILAEQHWHNFSNWFDPLGISKEWLTGRLKGSKRDRAIDRIAS
ncbi:MAG: DEAD/DEAH box helicase, partial [Halieaceae bacterium]|nr:DEAD/DEAH box helicase [Halieaceae bacterium]